MATLLEYYQTDFNRIMSAHSIWQMQKNGEIERNEIIAKVHLDFDSNTKYLSFYIPKVSNEFNVIKSIVSRFKEALMILDSTLIESKSPGEKKISSNALIFSGRIFIYINSSIDEEKFKLLEKEYHSKGIFLHIRDTNYSKERSKTEKPLAFISHDSRDKEKIASIIAKGLQKKMCPIWYDEYSLKVGDSLKESIEKGLKECKKCILVITPNFINNKGWTKVEFNSIFTREIIENKNIVLPVWYNISKEDVYEYCPTLVDRFGLQWKTGESDADKVIRKLHHAIIKED